MGPFHALLCVGQFFSPEADAEGAPGDVADYLEGRTAVPIPTYFTGDYGPTAPRLLSKAAAGARGFAPGGIEICPQPLLAQGQQPFHPPWCALLLYGQLISLANKTKRFSAPLLH